ncbi:hypothetical protein ACFFWC_06725 [Plantactinospora siamensis]|uniref:Uncharacterized protein n=1 Tax=Plantactinospora siamensis TaxID=555372 RepID=A0ABV6NX86_9ACTN
MSTQTWSADPARRDDVRSGPAGSGTGRAWLLGLGAAALAVGLVTAVAQAVDRFHWWAGFVLTPGALIAACGVPLLVRGGSRAVVGYVVTWLGLLVGAVGALLMLGAMGFGWPLMIILPALSVTGTYLWRPDRPLLRALHRSVATLGLVVAGLGATFLLLHAGWAHLRSGWWGAFLMAAGVAIAANGAEAARHRMPYRLSAVTLALGPAAVAFLLGLRFLRGF